MYLHTRITSKQITVLGLTAVSGSLPLRAIPHHITQHADHMKREHQISMKCCAAIRAIVHCFVTETPISKPGNDEAATKPWPRVPLLHAHQLTYLHIPKVLCRPLPDLSTSTNSSEASFITRSKPTPPRHPQAFWMSATKGNKDMSRRK